MVYFFQFAEHDAGTASSAYPTIKKTPFSVLNHFFFISGNKKKTRRATSENFKRIWLPHDFIKSKVLRKTNEIHCISMKLGTLVHHVPGSTGCLVFSNICLDTWLGSFKVEKRGKIITKLWKIIAKSLGKSKKSEATSMERSALFDIFASPRRSPLRMRQKWCHFSYFSKSFQAKKQLRLYDQRWLK